MDVKYKSTDCCGLAPFHLSVSVVLGVPMENIHQDGQHAHDEYEVYCNLSGDVSFMVENTIYPIRRGDIILTRPLEYHHCIYHSSAAHDHLWLLFSGKENERLFSHLLSPERGQGNRLSLSEQQLETLTNLCLRFVNEPLAETDKTLFFLRLLSLLEQGKERAVELPELPPELNAALNYIAQHLSEPFSIQTLARSCFVSVNTLERYFRSYLNISPLAYISKRRLYMALHYLSSGCSVTETSLLCGFSDCSFFIRKFRAFFGCTPLRYRKDKIDL